MQNSFELLHALKRAGYLKEPRDPLWWPNSGSFEAVVGAILTQNTRWENVEKALANLRARSNEITPEFLEGLHERELGALIRPSGFYNQKAERLKLLTVTLLEEYGDFESFQRDVSRERLLALKGVGPESADSILCYGCYREEMVADKYIYRLLRTFGYELEGYEEIKEWLSQGVLENYDRITELYGETKGINEIYARFHGKIVEFCKKGRIEERAKGLV